MIRTTAFGCEAINFQSKEEWFLGLVEKFRTIAAAPISLRYSAVKETGIEDYIHKETGVRLKFNFLRSNAVNAAIAIPILNSNHIFRKHVKDIKRLSTNTLFDNREVGHIFGKVDRINGRLEGTLSEETFMCFITAGALELWSPEEVAAIIVGHEIGHVFGYVENLNRTMSANLILESAVKELKGTNAINVNYSIISGVEQKLKIQYKQDIKELAKERNTELLQTVVVTEAIREIYGNRANSKLYDAISFEAVADQYASRMGMAIHLARAINKAEKAGNRLLSARGESYMYLAITAGILALNPVFGSAMIAIQIGTLGLTSAITGLHPEYQTYDTPNARLERLRLDMIARLRSDRTGDDPIIRLLIKDIEEVESMITRNNDSFSILKSLVSIVWRPFNRQSRLMKREQVLERLANNDLYVTAAKFKTTALEDRLDESPTGLISPLDILTDDQSSDRSKLKRMCAQSVGAELLLTKSAGDLNKQKVLDDLRIVKCAQDDYDDGVQELVVHFYDKWLTLTIQCYHVGNTHDSWLDYVDFAEGTPTEELFLALCLADDVKITKINGEKT